jgi:hypothetical protein
MALSGCRDFCLHGRLDASPHSERAVDRALIFPFHAHSISWFL